MCLHDVKALQFDPLTMCATETELAGNGLFAFSVKAFENFDVAKKKTIEKFLLLDLGLL